MENVVLKVALYGHRVVLSPLCELYLFIICEVPPFSPNRNKCDRALSEEDRCGQGYVCICG